MHRHALFLLCGALACVLLFGAANALIDLPPQGCANQLYNLNGDNLWVHFNGSRLSANIPTGAGGSTQSDTVIYYQFSEVMQLQRTGSNCVANKNPVIETLSLSSCNCTLEPYSVIANNVNTTGFLLTAFGCPAPQQDLIVTATITVSNDTASVHYNNTMEYSIADSFTYTSPYVQAEKSRFSRKAEFMHLRILAGNFRVCHGGVAPANRKSAERMEKGVSWKRNLGAGFFWMMPKLRCMSAFSRRFFCDSNFSIGPSVPPSLFFFFFDSVLARFIPLLMLTLCYAFAFFTCMDYETVGKEASSLVSTSTTGIGMTPTFTTLPTRPTSPLV